MAQGEILKLMGDEVGLADTFEGLYRSSVDEMTRVAYLITGSSHTAEEIAHDSFIAIRRRWDSINNPRAYLRQTVVNRSRSHLRRLRTQRAAAVDRQPSFEMDDIDETWDAIQALPVRQRTALVLRYYVDMSIRDIADAMDIRQGTVKSVLHRGRETLRKELT